MSSVPRFTLRGHERRERLSPRAMAPFQDTAGLGGISTREELRRIISEAIIDKSFDKLEKHLDRMSELRGLINAF